MKISVVIPALNEELGIEPTIDDIPIYRLRQIGYSVEVIVVDGGSKDKTCKIAKEKGGIVITELRRGYGRAYKTGFSSANGEIIVTLDADNTYPSDKIPDLVEYLVQNQLEFISTNRFSQSKPNMSILRFLGNKILTFMTQFLFHLCIKDSQSGMWVFRRSVLSHIKLLSNGMGFSEEIKIRAFINCRGKELQIPYKKRMGKTKQISWKDGIKNLVFLFKLWQEMRR